jgi:AraC-like DNA-binding protein/quercetin dioxygenase-like cupin family protein
MPKPSSLTKNSVRRTSVPPLDPMGYAPSHQRPVRAKLRHLAADTDVPPHQHTWAQVAMSSTGVIRMRAGRSTYLVPPSRVLWIPPGVEHAVTVVEAADIRTLYIHQSDNMVGPGCTSSEHEVWSQCRVLEASSLLRELVVHLPSQPSTSINTSPDARELSLSHLVLDELRHARAVPLGLDLPDDKRLRQLCEAVLADPARWITLESCAHLANASTRTVARLFRSELGSSFGQWRQQVLLSQALVLAAKGKPMAHIAGSLGYASASAFSAMVTRTVGMPPSRFFGK